MYIIRASGSVSTIRPGTEHSHGRPTDPGIVGEHRTSPAKPFRRTVPPAHKSDGAHDAGFKW